MASGAGVEVERVFVGAGCNRIVNNVSWGPSGLVAFGAQNAVAIFCPKRAQILTTLPGHKAIVNCTSWLPSCKDAFKVQHAEQHFLLSGSADGTIILWGLQLKEGRWSKAFQVPETHKKGVTCLSGILISESICLFASSSSDGTVCIWELIIPACLDDEPKISRLENLFVGSKPMVTLSLSEIPGNPGHVILAMGGLDHKIYLYYGDETKKFVQACQLKEHTDWIRSLEFSLPISSNKEKDSLFLVSASQDRNIRIWKMELLLSSANTEMPYRKGDTGLTSYIKGPIFVVGSSSYQVSVESVLVGHEDWVYSVRWQPPRPTTTDGNEYYQPLSILSASMDKTMMIWRPHKKADMWVNEVIVGELSHSAFGFYGGHWCPDGESILAHGYGGSFHLWRNIGVENENWQPQRVPSGHFAAVSDIAWFRSGEYVLSVSHDQTSRIFAPWRNDTVSGEMITWHEIARPQVHGHDINCVAIIKGGGNHRFVCGADEKVARVFEAPLSFLKTLNHAIIEDRSNFEDLHEHVKILGANMSALGLSQKPIYINAANETSKQLHKDELDSLETIPDAVPVVLTEPPVEDQLAWHTLWPESHKLYGHGNELFSLCSDHEGKLVASSCKAQTINVAEIWLWQIGTWKAVGRLQSHSLTVTQMEFSHDDSFLLAVSRDRQFSVFSITKSGEVSYNLVAKHEAHKRIIWACSWNPFRHEFATGSRDKTVKIWSVENASSVKQVATLPRFRDSVTALSWLGCDRANNSGLLAVGMDNGLIELWSLTCPELSELNAALAVRFDSLLCHVSTVHRLTWRNSESSDSGTMQLASCGADNCVRVFQVFNI